MKKTILFLFLCLLITGCRNELKCLEGTYSYKVSGKAVIDAGDSTNTVVLGMEILCDGNHRSAGEQCAADF